MLFKKLILAYSDLLPSISQVSHEMNILYIAGLEKLTNLNRSVSSVNDRLFPVELTEIAD